MRVWIFPVVLLLTWLLTFGPMPVLDFFFYFPFVLTDSFCRVDLFAFSFLF